MSIFRFLRPAIFVFEPEFAHIASLKILRLSPIAYRSGDGGVLRTRIAGLELPGVIGLAAGYDKDAIAADKLADLGFAATEVGTLTPRPQAGNPRPRLFRLVEDEAVINRMGFNNGGQAAAIPRIRAAREGGAIVGVNIGANKETENKIDDYAIGVKAMAPIASYLTLNISSPNTPGLRNLQDAGALRALIDAAIEARGALTTPMFLKVAPDLELADIDAIAGLVTGKMDALIVSNTTISRPELRSRHAHEPGGLSGRPLAVLAQNRLADFHKATGGGIPLIGVGGIASAEDAYARIRAGASFLQLYSALVYHGPGLVRRINRKLEAMLARDGFSSVFQAVGVDAR